MSRKTIARYEVKSEIGRGGMASVYLAYDPNFRRDVAVKLVSVNLQENLVYRERFEREAHLIAAIEHPAIVPVYDFGEEDNQPFLVMRYMPGGSLADKIKQGVLSLGEAAKIIAQLAPALDAVHARGIVHRDLKPGNILLDSFGNAAISDFGIAHLSTATTDLTGSAIIGTPAYMSPEQVRGEAELDGRSDIYSLGIILFEMFTNRGPFEATTPLSAALKHLNELVPPIHSFRPDLPIDIEIILNKALAKERDMRYASASDFALELQAAADSFKADGVPLLVKTPPGDELPTEIDTNEESLPDLELSAAQSKVGTASSPDSVKPPSSPAAQRRSSGGFLKFAALGGFSLFALTLCGLLVLGAAWFGLGNRNLAAATTPDELPAQNELPTQSELPTQDYAPPLNESPDPQPTPSNLSRPEVLYFDDFLDPLSGWPIYDDSLGRYSYESRGYNIFVAQQNEALWARTEDWFENSSIMVEATPVTRDAQGYYGLQCRVSSQEFYYFVVHTNGTFTIGRYTNDQFQSILSGGWRQSEAINRGAQTNLLRVDCDEDMLRFHANDTLLAEVVNADFSSGYAGIIVASLDTQGFEVSFSNLMVTTVRR